MNANAATITSMTVTGGSLVFNALPGTVSDQYILFSSFGPNTNLVGGYINGGISSPNPDPNAIAVIAFFSSNFYSASMSNTGSFSIPGGPIPTGDIIGSNITMDLSSLIWNVSGLDMNVGSPTATGSANCVGASCTYTLTWASAPGALYAFGPSATSTWTLTGTAEIAAVPVPATAWLLMSGIAGLFGLATRNQPRCL